MEKKKILVIDDEEILTRTFVRLLEKNGYEAFFVKTGADAVEIVKEIDFDLIITDMRMPGMNGYETLKGIREACHEQNKQSPPEIIVTGYADECLEKQVKELRPAVYLYKPFDVKVLLDHVKRLVS
ncbi:MAG: response regulator [Candidatus Omnitrophica bacterium]|nr:response regulator [Candidatus Omnitrophota bacterium]MDD5671624.1 response regulator [Candidatus Omnitrophota bacterium]